MRTTLRRLALTGVLIVPVGVVWSTAQVPVFVSAIRTSPRSRAAYLGRARIWQDPGALSPTRVFEGPSGAFPYTFAEANSDDGISCTFTQPGKELSGNSPKFLCRTADGRDLRLKYWDPIAQTGNREVFATVAATRLLWALGFGAIPTLPINVRCDGCPENPMKDTGARRARRYVAILQPPWPLPILSIDDIDQGWSWRELDSAIRALPPGPDRVRQRTHFDALTLLGVLIQHGDRKSDQQRLYCAAPIDTAAGDLRSFAGDSPSMLFERPDAPTCPTPAITIVDAGATFGEAGRESNPTTAKMNLESWRRKPVFRDVGSDGCRGDLTVSLRAGHSGEPDPIISEEGRRFLMEQLGRLTPDHVRALFRAARVDELIDSQPNHDSSVDAWVAVFQDKVRQIDARRCQPAN